jgi:hypothetical protein
MKDKHKVFDILLQCSNAPISSIFIELFDSSLGDDLTPGGSSMRSLIVSSQYLASQLPQPSSPAGNI